MNIMLSPTTVIIATVFCTSAAFAADKSAKVDLTPVFTGMEKDCASSNPKFQALMGWLVTQTGKAPIGAKASSELRAAIGSGRIKVEDGGEFWTLTVPTPNASYRGAALISINRWVGKDNGYNGISLKFTGTPAVISKSIGKVGGSKIQDEYEQTMPQLVPEGASRTVLVCDFSN